MAALKVGDVVLVGKVQERGTVRFVGETKFSSGEWVGVELDNAAGKNDGTVLDHRYFECPQQHGIFVRATALTKVEAGVAPAAAAAAAAAPPKAAPKRAATLEKASPKRAASSLKEAAAPKAAAPAPVAQPPVVSSVAAAPAAAAPATASSGGAVATDAKAKAAPNVKKAVSFPETGQEDGAEALDAFKEEQRIMLFGQGGIVRFVGPTKFGEGAWIGIEFDDPIGKCDGSVGGVPYFNGKLGHCIFFQAPCVDPEDVRSERRMSRSHSITTRRGSLKNEMRMGRVFSGTSSAGFAGEIDVAGGGNLQILDDDGNLVDIEDLIQAFEESREELEGVQELLDEAHDRERELRAEIKELRASGLQALQPTHSSRGSVASLRRQSSALQVSSLLTIAGATGVDIFDNIIMLTDSYRVTQHFQYPPGTETIYSYLESSGGDVVFFGLQYYLKKHLVGQVVSVEKINAAEGFFRDHFAREQFSYDKRIFNRNGWEYILRQHEGKLPVVIKAVPEGTVVPANNVLLTIENTDPKCFWLTSYLESLLSQLWYPVAVSTQSRAQKKVIMQYLKDTGAGEGTYRFKLHDFGFRESTGVEPSALGGLGHLVNFSSSDALSALLLARDYYSCDCASTAMVGTDAPIVKGWGPDKEVDALRSIVKSTPAGFVACVGDAFDAIAACSSIFGGELKSLIEKRDGCVLIRLEASKTTEALLKVLEALESKFGSEMTPTGFKLLPPCIRVIQVDSLTAGSLEAVLSGLKEGGWASDNVSFGCATTLQALASTPQNLKFRCSYMKVRGKDSNLAVDAEAKSGRLTLELQGGQWTTVSLGEGDASKDRLVEVFRNGKLLVDDTLGAIRKRSEGATVNPRSADILEGPTGARRGKPPAMKPPPGVPKGRPAAMSALKEKSEQVKHLSEDLVEKAGKLKQIQTRRAEGKVAPDDVAWMSKIYEENSGDLDKLAQLCGVPRAMLEKSPPKDAADFARKLLSGAYTGETSDLARAELKHRLQDALVARKGTLRRTTTKEMSGVAAPEEVELVSVIYTKYRGDLDTIAAECGVSRTALDKYKPVDGKDFARKLLLGFYTENADDAAKANLRTRLQEQILRQASSLRRTHTKEASGAATQKDIERIAKLYRDSRGNLDQLARVCGASISLLRRRPPKSDEEFAKNLLEGVYTGDAGSVAKAELRERLREDLQRKASTLRRTTTKEMSGPTDVEVAAVAKFYLANGGDIQKISSECDLSLELLQKCPPTDATDFGRKVLMGMYTADKSDQAKARLRDTLVMSLLERKSTLKRTETKTGGVLSDMELEFAGKIFTASGGDLQKLSEACGVPLSLLNKCPPSDAKDFAKKLFDGLYNLEQTDAAKAELRSRLRSDLMGQIQKLKPAIVKEANLVVSKVELERFAKVYTQSRGNVDFLVQKFHISPELLRRTPPENANDFAKKLLDGFYTGDTTQMAKASLRERLRDDLQRQAQTLKRTETNAGKTACPASADVTHFAEVYNKLGGNLEKLAQALQIDLGTLQSRPPQTPEEFARKLLNGDYTGDQTELARKFLKTKLKKRLQEQLSCLKRTTTREAMVEPEAQDIDLVAQLYTKLGGDLRKIAAKINLDPAILEQNPPADATDFARKLFAGAFSVEASAKAQHDLRNRLREELQRQSSMLKRTTTKEMSGDATPEDISAVSKLWFDCRGNLETVASMTGCSIELLRKKPPSDGETFAKNLLEGVYTGETHAIVIAQLRGRLQEDINSQASKLKRTATKEMTGPLQSDVDAVVAIYNKEGGNLDALAGRFHLNKPLLRDCPPEDAQEFARALLEGRYTADAAENAKATLRDSLGVDLKRQSSKLRRTTTKEATGEAAVEDIEQLAKVYDMYDGNLQRLAELCGISQELLQKKAPTNGTEFASRLLDGSYTGDASEDAKKELRANLKAKLLEKKSTLRRTTTKEMSGEALPEDIVELAKVFSDCRGDLSRVAKRCGLDAELLLQRLPKDAMEFAKHFLEGRYTGVPAEMAKKRLRELLKEDLQAGAAQLKRTTTKEASGPSEEDLRSVVLLYRQYAGDHQALAKLTGVSYELLRRSPPESAEEFARNLLIGAYCVDATEAAKEKLRDNLHQDINRTSSKLRRTTTKETSGAASDEDIVLFSKLYDKAMGRGGGGLEELASLCGIPVEMIRKSAPSSAASFAKNLLEGAYSVEASEAAKFMLRDELKSQLDRTKTTLKRTATKEATGDCSADDIAAVASVYSQLKGDLDGLAKFFVASANLMRRAPPTDADDFARKLLQGEYAGEQGAEARALLRERLRKDLDAGRKRLRRTTTRESASPEEEDIQVLAKMYASYKGDIDAICKTWCISSDLVRADPPEDARDFALKLLDGRYTKDFSEAAKAEMRQNLKADIARCSSQLRRTTTKETTGEPDREDVAKLAAWYNSKNGDLAAIADAMGISRGVFERNPPADAVDFARKMLSGAYACDSTELAKAELRNGLAAGLMQQKSVLKRTTTKEHVGPSEEDLEYIATVYDHKGGNLEILASLFSQSLELMERNVPADRMDFAQKLLQGRFMGDTSDMARATFRDRLAEDVAVQRCRLKRTTTKEAGGPKEEQVQAIAQIYAKFAGNLVELSNAVGISLQALEKYPPINGRDFALKLLMGQYSIHMDQAAKAELRSRLKDEIAGLQGKLKRTTTKEAVGEPQKQDLANAAVWFANCEGDLEKLAGFCCVPKAVIEKSPPKDAIDFARKFLTGVYSCDEVEASKAELRKAMKGDLVRQASTLRRTATKDAASGVTAEDVEAVARLYNDKGGDLNKLAAATGANSVLMKKSPPKDAADFARKLLEGAYSADDSACSKELFITKLRQDLGSKRTELRRTETREASGPSEEDLLLVSTIYTRCQGNFLRIAKACDVPHEMLEIEPPADAMDFARKLLAGAYSGGMTEADKASLQDKLAKAKKRQQQKRAAQAPKGKGKGERQAPSEASPEQIALIEKLYNKSGGDLDAIARILNLPDGAFAAVQPAGGQEFAKTLLAGGYGVDSSGSDFNSQLKKSMSALRRTATKECTGEAVDEDVEALAKIYDQQGGDPEKLARACLIRVELLRAQPPENGRDFARKLLTGAYNGDALAICKAELRNTLGADIQRQASLLKRTTTKETTGPSEEDLVTVMKVHEELKGDLVAISDKFGISLRRLEDDRPRDGRDFAVRLLAGEYSLDATEDAKSRFRERLLTELGITSCRLKRTTTKEAVGAASPQDIQDISKIFLEAQGDQEKLSKLFGIHPDLLHKFPPEDPQDFARKLLGGTYAFDRSEAAKADLRDNLASSLGKTKSQLRRTTTKEATGEASDEDVAQLAQLHMHFGGDLDKLGETCGVSAELLQCFPPESPEDFARKLLQGVYSGDQSDLARAGLRSRLREELQVGISQLKRTTTKEAFGDVSDDDLEAVSALYSIAAGSLQVISDSIGVPVHILEMNPPKDAKDFAKKLLTGAYAVDSSELAKAQFRERMGEELNESAGKLKRTVTRVGTFEVPLEDVEEVSRYYSMAGGDLDRIAESLGLSRSLLEQRKPTDPFDFARKLLQGMFSADQTEEAKAQLRNTLKTDLTEQKARLKRSETKEASGDLQADDVKAIAGLYTQVGGKLEKLAMRCGISLELLKAKVPLDAEDFARKLLRGAYSTEAGAAPQEDMVRSIREEILQRKTTLRRTITKQYTGIPEDDLTAIELLYRKYHGDIVQIAKACGIPVEVFKKCMPKDARDFAEKLLSGMYTTDMTEVAKAELRSRLADDLKDSAAKLKRTTTKEYSGHSQEDIRAVEAIYDYAKGDLEQISKVTGVPLSVLNTRPPTGATDFALKVLAGFYDQDTNEIAKRQLRDKLQMDLQASATKLRRTTTKELAGQITDEDVQFWSHNLAEHRDKLPGVAKVLGVNYELMRSYSTGDAVDFEDFARKLLEGAFSGDDAALARQSLLKTLPRDLQRQATSIRRTVTREMTFFQPQDQDIHAMEELYVRLHGDTGEMTHLLDIAKQCGIDADLLLKSKPVSKTDFAYKVLAGQYSPDGDAAPRRAKSTGAKGLEGGIHKQITGLRRTTTRTYSGLQEDEVNAVAALYRKNNGDLRKLAQLMQIDHGVLMRDPPKDATDFAHKLLTGQYSVDMTEARKKDLRGNLLGELQKQASTLKRTTTKEGIGPSSEELAAIASIYTQHGGDPDAIALACTGINRDLLREHPPVDAKDFARRLLEGSYSADAAAAAQARLRQALPAELARSASALKRATTKEWDGKASEDDVTLVAKIYDANGGDLRKIAQVCGLSYDLLSARPPKDSRDFAANLLGGAYSGEASAIAQKALRSTLTMTLKDGATPGLKRTTTKEYTGEPDPKEVAAVARAIEDLQQDWEQISRLFGVSAELMRATAGFASSSEDLAKNLLMGLYSDETSEEIRTRLQNSLAAELKRSASNLRRTATRESMAHPQQADVEAIARLYEENSGNLDRLAALCGADVALLRMSPPADGTDFAIKFLKGFYSLY